MDLLLRDPGLSGSSPLDGRRRIAEGREAEVFEWDDGLVLRLARSAAWATGVATSTAASEAARRAGVRTPRVVETVEIDGRPGQIFERVEGGDLFAALAANPLRVRRIAHRLAAVHAELHDVIAPPELPANHEVLSSHIEASVRVPDHVKRGALAVLEGLPRGDRICHGDFHPGNVLESPDGPTVIDWTNATCGDPAADVARTTLMLQVGEVPPGSPWLIRGLATVGRGALWRLYLRAYARARGLDDALVHRWTLVAAANRLTEEVESERPALLRLLSTAFPQG